ncbi:MAG: hypothetical protein K6G90_12590 [Clostridia bacterium]|nr:hypothetical protein [Clostridia bacterium]
MKQKKFFLMAAVLLFAVLMAVFAVTSFAARLPGDIDNDGVITAADARLWLRISARLEKIEDYYSPEELEGYSGDTDPAGPSDANFKVSFGVADGGYFIAGESKAAITLTSDADVKSATLSVIDVMDETVYRTTVRDIKKEIPVTVEWDGKTASGEYVGSGDYTVSVGSGDNAVKSESLYFTAKNWFSAGNGSETNPFLIGNKEDVENIIRYPRANYKQIKDIDYDYATAKSMFTKDLPFNGVYDGNNKKLLNLIAKDSLFTYVGEDGSLINITFIDGSFYGDGGIVYENSGIMKNIKTENGSFSSLGGLAYTNNGKILDCDLDVLMTGEYKKSNYYEQNINIQTYLGVVAANNNGLISGCKLKGSFVGIITNHSNAPAGARDDLSGYIGAIAGCNKGRVINCISDVSVHVVANSPCTYAYSGGLVGVNGVDGSIQNSESKGSVTGEAKKHSYCICGAIGGIASNNGGQIKNCIYSGESDVNLAGTGSGIIA